MLQDKAGFPASLHGAHNLSPFLLSDLTVLASWKQFTALRGKDITAIEKTISSKLLTSHSLC